MIVVDVNLISYFWLDTPQSATATRVRRKDFDWHVPELWLSEFRNVLATYIRQDLLTYSEAWWVAQNAEDDLRGSEHAVETADVLKLAEQADHSAYDCEYVALAQALDVKLVIGDKAVARDFPRTAILMEDFAA